MADVEVLEAGPLRGRVRLRGARPGAGAEEWDLEWTAGSPVLLWRARTRCAVGPLRLRPLVALRRAVRAVHPLGRRVGEGVALGLDDRRPAPPAGGGVEARLGGRGRRTRGRPPRGPRRLLPAGRGLRRPRPPGNRPASRMDRRRQPAGGGRARPRRGLGSGDDLDGGELPALPRHRDAPRGAVGGATVRPPAPRPRRRLGSRLAAGAAVRSGAPHAHVDREPRGVRRRRARAPASRTRPRSSSSSSTSATSGGSWASRRERGRGCRLFDPAPRRLVVAPRLRPRDGAHPGARGRRLVHSGGGVGEPKGVVVPAARFACPGSGTAGG